LSCALTWFVESSFVEDTDPLFAAGTFVGVGTADVGGWEASSVGLTSILGLRAVG
jgi:hypothetical protein